METLNQQNRESKKESFFAIKENNSIKIFHTILGFRLISLPEGVQEDNVSMTAPSGIFYDNPVINYIINK